jgi:hypothetical protein
MVKTQVGAGFLFAHVRHSLQTSAIRAGTRYAEMAKRALAMTSLFIQQNS